jgi:hypothetical protein
MKVNISSSETDRVGAQDSLDDECSDEDATENNVGTSCIMHWDWTAF